MNTHEKNIIIAKFMGGKLHEHPELNGVKVWTGYDPINNKLNLPNNIRFDKDWNLLMPVAKKIVAFVPTNINDAYNEIFEIIIKE